MYRYSLCKMLFAMLVALVSATPNAFADLIISFGPSNGLNSGPISFLEGQESKLNVLIQRDSAQTPPLESFTVWVNLERISGLNPNGLLFATTQQESQLNSPNYVFNNVSSGLIGTVENSGLQYQGTDTTTANNAVTVPQSNRLLFSLDVSPIAQGEYRISVSAANSSFISPDFNSIPFTSSPGTISVTAVPEPSSLFILMVAIGVAAVPCSRRMLVLRKCARQTN